MLLGMKTCSLIAAFSSISRTLGPHCSRSIPIGQELQVIVGKGSGRIWIGSGVREWSGHRRKGFGTLSESGRVIVRKVWVAFGKESGHRKGFGSLSESGRVIIYRVKRRSRSRIEPEFSVPQTDVITTIQPRRISQYYRLRYRVPS